MTTSRVRHARRLALVVCVLLLAGCGLPLLGGSGGGARVADAEDAWNSAGVDEPRITEHSQGGRTTVEVEVDATALPLEDEENTSGFAVRAAVIAWRTHEGRIDVLEIRTPGHDADGPVSRTWQRAELEEMFGPRPDGLDEGRGPAPLPRGDSRYTAAPEALDEAVALYRALVEETAQEALRADPGAVEIGEPQECLKLSFEGEVPTGTFQQSVETTVRAPDGVRGYAAQPVTARYWAELGLDVDARSFVSGTPTLYADLPGDGKASLTVLPERPSELHLSATTGCLDPAT